MILSCPSCRTRYRVDEGELVSGRTLRCANCGHTWHHAAAPPPPSPTPRVPRPAPSAPAVSRVEAAPLAGRSGRPAVVVFLVLILLIAAAIGLYAGRHKLIALWPPAARLYALVRAAPQPLGAGLTIGEIMPKRTPEGLIIKGEVTNTSKVERQVPPLRIALRARPKPSRRPSSTLRMRRPGSS
jgi:predicted Zn finger-like uncharacterized protein